MTERLINEQEEPAETSSCGIDDSATLIEPPKEHLPSFGRSLGWLVLFLVVFFAAVVVYLVGYSIALGIEYGVQGLATADPQVMEAQIEQHLIEPNGFVGIYLTQCLLLLPLVLLAANFRSQSWRTTLAVNFFEKRQLVVWLAVWLVFFAVQWLVNQIFNIDPGEFMRSLSNTKHLPLALVLVICAPLLEELVFRGYLFKAWRHTRLGLSGTLLLTSVLFTLLHAGQYHFTILVMIFVLSIILGLAREKSGSIWVPIAIHSANNLVAAITVIYFGIL